MQFLVLNERNTTDFEAGDFTPDRVTAEVKRVRELYGEGFVRQIWHRGDLPGGVLLVEAVDETEARRQMSTLPLVAADMVRVASVVPLKPFGGFAA